VCLTGTGKIANIEYFRGLVWKYEGHRNFTDPAVDGKIILPRNMGIWNEVCNEGHGT
jgi:hypothetical protein